jgi:hypothetical protein
MGRVALSEVIYVLIRIQQTLAESWEVDLYPRGSNLEVHVIKKILYSRLGRVVRPSCKDRVDFLSGVFAEFEPIKNCTMGISSAAEIGNFAQNHTLP